MLILQQPIACGKTLYTLPPVLLLCYEEKSQRTLKKTENNKKNQAYKMLKIVKTKLEMYATGTSLLAHKNEGNMH